MRGFLSLGPLLFWGDGVAIGNPMAPLLNGPCVSLGSRVSLRCGIKKTVAKSPHSFFEAF
jgi:hypothetical protein